LRLPTFIVCGAQLVTCGALSAESEPALAVCAQELGALVVKVEYLNFQIRHRGVAC
jgi:hypothetical protein